MMFERVYRDSIDHKEAFWGKAAEAIDWYRTWDRVLDDSHPPFSRWFEGGIMNTCYNAIDRHVEQGRGEQRALIYDSPVTRTVRVYTYRELLGLVSRVAGGLAGTGVSRGDRVVIYMPMIPEAVIAMLACARIGAVHSVVFGGFAPGELATRIEDSRPKVIVTSSCGIEVNRIIPYKPIVDEAIRMCSFKPGTCIIVQRPESRADLVLAGTVHGTIYYRPLRIRASRLPPPIRCTSCIRQERLGNQKESSGITAAISSPSHGA